MTLRDLGGLERLGAAFRPPASSRIRAVARSSAALRGLVVWLRFHSVANRDKALWLLGKAFEPGHERSNITEKWIAVDFEISPRLAAGHGQRSGIRRTSTSVPALRCPELISALCVSQLHPRHLVFSAGEGTKASLVKSAVTAAFTRHF